MTTKSAEIISNILPNPKRFMMKGDHNDPKALIRESFNIEGITIENVDQSF